MCSKLGKVRYDSLDALRLLLAFFVVYIHSSREGLFGQILMSIAVIAVPTFFMISGFFMFNSEDSNNGLKRLRKQFWLILRVTILSSALYFAFAAAFNILIKKQTIELFIYNTLSNDMFQSSGIFVFDTPPYAGHIWYLFAYLYVLLIYMVIVKRIFDKKFQILVALIVATLLILNIVLGMYSPIVFNHEINIMVTFKFLGLGFTFFTLGVFARKQIENKLSEKWNRLLILLIILFTITSLLEKVFLDKVFPNSYLQYFISTPFLVITIFLYFVNNSSFLSSTILPKLGREYSMYIYIFHILVMNLINICIKFIGIENTSSPFYAIASFVLSFAMAVIFKYLFKGILKNQRFVFHINR